MSSCHVISSFPADGSAGSTTPSRGGRERGGVKRAGAGAAGLVMSYVLSYVICLVISHVFSCQVICLFHLMRHVISCALSCLVMFFSEENEAVLSAQEWELQVLSRRVLCLMSHVICGSCRYRLDGCHVLMSCLCLFFFSRARTLASARVSASVVRCAFSPDFYFSSSPSSSPPLCSSATLTR